MTTGRVIPPSARVAEDEKQLLQIPTQIRATELKSISHHALEDPGPNTAAACGASRKGADFDGCGAFDSRAEETRSPQRRRARYSTTSASVWDSSASRGWVRCAERFYDM